MIYTRLSKFVENHFDSQCPYKAALHAPFDISFKSSYDLYFLPLLYELKKILNSPKVFVRTLAYWIRFRGHPVEASVAKRSIEDRIAIYIYFLYHINLNWLRLRNQF